MEREYHAIINGEYIEGEEFEKFVTIKYGTNWKEILDNMPVGDRHELISEDKNGIEVWGIYEGPIGF